MSGALVQVARAAAAGRDTRRTGAAALALALLVLAGCAQLPPPAAPASAGADLTELQRVLQQRRAQAQRLEAAGELRAAVEQWQIVLLLAPGDPGAGAALARTEARRQQALAEALASAASARRRNDAEAATAALLQALALDPDQGAAAEQLRQIEQQKMARIQAARVARQRVEPPGAYRDPAHRPPPPAGNGARPRDD